MLSVFCRSHSGFLLKYSAKVGKAAETAGIADLRHAHPLICQQNFYVYDPCMQDIFHYRHTNGFFEFTAKVIFAHVQVCAYMLNLQWAENVLIDVLQGLWDQSVRGRTALRAVLLQECK